MGTSGTNIYSDDFACDIRAEYIEKLRCGKTGIEATAELVESYKSILNNMDDASVFWFALADTQWEYGRLLPEVRDNALEYLSRKEELERWKEVDERRLNDWLSTRAELSNKLMLPQPKEKKVSKHRLYKCKWKLGDIFAYRFDSEYSREKDVFGQYIIFRKVSEDMWWPGHIVPTVYVYKWIGKEIPSIDDIIKMPLLPQKYIPIAYVKYPNKDKEYQLNLLVTTSRQIPQDRLIFIGNIQDKDIVPYKYEPNSYKGYDYVDWKQFEVKILEQYFAWNDID